MRTRLATRCVASALALALSIAPALAGGPSCCRGQRADSGSTGCACCQQNPALDQATADDAPDGQPQCCCAAKKKSCCASRAKSKSSTEPGLAVKTPSSKCCCKARPPILAVSETQLDLRIKHDTLVTARVDVALKAQVHETLALHRGQGEILPAPSLQRLLCRWVV